jgi:hypothetical protein
MHPPVIKKLSEKAKLARNTPTPLHPAFMEVMQRALYNQLLSIFASLWFSAHPQITPDLAV